MTNGVIIPFKKGDSDLINGESVRERVKQSWHDEKAKIIKAVVANRGDRAAAHMIAANVEKVTLAAIAKVSAEELGMSIEEFDIAIAIIDYKARH